jgi:hypothetical protein
MSCPFHLFSRYHASHPISSSTPCQAGIGGVFCTIGLHVLTLFLCMVQPVCLPTHIYDGCRCSTFCPIATTYSTNSPDSAFLPPLTFAWRMFLNIESNRPRTCWDSRCLYVGALVSCVSRYIMATSIWHHPQTVLGRRAMSCLLRGVEGRMPLRAFEGSWDWMMMRESTIVTAFTPSTTMPRKMKDISGMR